MAWAKSLAIQASDHTPVKWDMLKFFSCFKFTQTYRSLAHSIFYFKS